MFSVAMVISCSLWKLVRVSGLAEVPNNNTMCKCTMSNDNTFLMQYIGAALLQ